MKIEIIKEIQQQMNPYLTHGSYMKLTKVLTNVLDEIEIVTPYKIDVPLDNSDMIEIFLSAKNIEGCSENTIKYYKQSLNKLFKEINKKVNDITTEDIRHYLSNYKESNRISKTTLDNNRRIFSSFFTWLEEEGYILKNPIKRIHRVKTPRVVKETFTDEDIERLCDNCTNLRDRAIIEILLSTGVRVGELIRLDIDDINFNEKECIVLGKGDAERIVYFNAKCKIHLQQYLDSRTDSNPALFVSLRKPHYRLGINGVEFMLKKLGEKTDVNNVHPHKFRRTLATKAIDKGMPIEQVQKLLGHMQIDTTLHYAMVNQSNVKISHHKFIG